MGAAAVVCAPLGALASQAGLARPGNGTLSSPQANVSEALSKKKMVVQKPQANVSEALSKNKMVVKKREGLLTESVVDPATEEVLMEFRLPSWWPKRLRPPRWGARDVADSELALAGVVAGGATEIVRVGALYPLTTVKTRVQALRDASATRVGLDDLYAGAGPAIAAATPAAACYYGARDLAKRFVAESPAARGWAASALTSP